MLAHNNNKNREKCLAKEYAYVRKLWVVTLLVINVVKIVIYS